jgi:hypothetical protein
MCLSSHMALYGQDWNRSCQTLHIRLLSLLLLVACSHRSPWRWLWPSWSHSSSFSQAILELDSCFERSVEQGRDVGWWRTFQMEWHQWSPRSLCHFVRWHTNSHTESKRVKSKREGVPMGDEIDVGRRFGEDHFNLLSLIAAILNS